MIIVKKGDKYGRWLVLSEIKRHIDPHGIKRRNIFCECECGTKREVLLISLRSGNSFSCGCLKVERIIIYNKNINRETHGKSLTPEYRAWQDMKQRCNNPNVISYSRYGGRDIGICDRWDKFENFLNDMGLRPSIHHSLDRIDNNGDYAQENCRWATRSEQQNNKRLFPKNHYTAKRYLRESHVDN